MTVLSRQAGFADSQPSEVPSHRRAVVLRWEVSREALHTSRPDLVRLAQRNEPVLLEWCVEIDGAGVLGAQASLVDPQAHDLANRMTPLLSTRGMLFEEDHKPTWIDDGVMVHVDIPGLLMLSLRKAVLTDTLLYARTSILGVLGLPGGRYESATLSGSPRQP